MINSIDNYTENNTINEYNDKKIMFVRLSVTGDNPYYNNIKEIELKILEDSNKNELSSDDELSDDINDNEFSQLCDNDNYLFVNTESDNDLNEQFADFINNNIPFDGILYIVAYDKDIDFIMNMININSEIKNNNIILIDSCKLAKKMIKPFTKDNVSWWGEENIYSNYTFKNICKHLDIKNDHNNINAYIELYKYMFDSLDLDYNDINSVKYAFSLPKRIFS